MSRCDECCMQTCLLLPIEEEVVNKLNDILFEDAQPSTSYQQIPVFHFSVSLSKCRKHVMSTFCLQQTYQQIAAETSEGLHQVQVDTTCTLTTSFGELSGSENVFLLVCCNQPMCCSQLLCCNLVGCCAAPSIENICSHLMAFTAIGHVQCILACSLWAKLSSTIVHAGDLANSKCIRADMQSQHFRAASAG